MSRVTQQLPEAEANKLQELRNGGAERLPQLRARVALLREAGWSLAAVGAPLGANRSTTRMWQLAADAADVAKSAKQLGKAPSPPAKQASLKVVRKFPDVPPSDRDEFVQLAESARQVRGHTKHDSPARQDAQKFETKLKTYKKRGVPVKRMADIIGITHHAVASRIDRANKRDQLKRAS